jgi:hypothetical protein
MGAELFYPHVARHAVPDSPDRRPAINRNKLWVNSGDNRREMRLVYAKWCAIDCLTQFWSMSADVDVDGPAGHRRRVAGRESHVWRLRPLLVLPQKARKVVCL